MSRSASEPLLLSPVNTNNPCGQRVIEREAEKKRRSRFAAGNVTRIEHGGRPTLDLTWNSLYQLVSVSTNGIFAESYAYDALSRRVSTTTLEGTTRHVYDNDWQVIADIDENGNVIASYTWGEGIDKLLAVTIGGVTYYALTDIQGTVWGYVDSQNNVVARWQYDVWGNVVDEYVAVSATALAILRYRFQGREWSAATGLINFRMRWYDAETGRWISKDPIGLSGGLNLYVFCGGDPLNYRDPDGNVLIFAPALALPPVAVVGAAAAAAIWGPQLASGLINSLSSLGNAAAQALSNLMGRGPSHRPGERNWADKPGGTSNPGKHFRQDPNTGRWWQKDPNGKWHPKPPKFSPGGVCPYLLPEDLEPDDNDDCGKNE